ncbi:hypothetical protein [Mucilaginibacter boryungensis]|uniref:DUF4468 domain-containing protein n=1 Tax=Mucilaginibacter boryungensis TaxID=768480 RepID=A0ABR9XLN5_9SPHI|nr:hypothetical protein [Mucilaginibacter boryungensis]MBE9668283.1 hypothetical protein [Mucilaginibacter boryungensis]
MKKFVSSLLTIALFVSVTAKAQNYYSDIQGNVLKENRADEAEGSPYLKDTWGIGSATIAKGTYDNMKLKYDLKNDVVVFASKDNVPMSFAEPVTRFIIDGMKFASGFPAIGAQVKDSYYQVLSDGKTKLLKHLAKHIEETKTYGSATANRTYVATATYYVFKDDKMSAIKPDKKAVMAVMADKAGQMEDYLKNNKVNFKNDADLSQLFDKYNSL